MPPIKGSKKQPDGTYKLPEEAKEEVVAEETVVVEEEKEEPKFELTASQLQDFIRQAVKEATAAPEQGRIRNADLTRARTTSHIQTEEDAAQLAAATEGISHGAAVLPSPPEWLVSLDLEEHKQIIGDLTAMGYRVVINKAEFDIAWEPTKIEYIGDRQVNRPDGREETAEGKELKAVLENTTPRFSLTFQLERQAGRNVTNEYALHNRVAQYERNGFMPLPRTAPGHSAQVIAGLEARAGNMSGYDNLGIDLGSDAGAAAVEQVRVG